MKRWLKWGFGGAIIYTIIEILLFVAWLYFCIADKLGERLVCRFFFNPISWMHPMTWQIFSVRVHPAVDLFLPFTPDLVIGFVIGILFMKIQTFRWARMLPAILLSSVVLVPLVLYGLFVVGTNLKKYEQEQLAAIALQDIKEIATQIGYRS